MATTTTEVIFKDHMTFELHEEYTIDGITFPRSNTDSKYNIVIKGSVNNSSLYNNFDIHLNHNNGMSALNLSNLSINSLMNISSLISSNTQSRGVVFLNKDVNGNVVINNAVDIGVVPNTTSSTVDFTMVINLNRFAYNEISKNIIDNFKTGDVLTVSIHNKYVKTVNPPNKTTMVAINPPISGDIVIKENIVLLNDSFFMTTEYVQDGDSFIILPILNLKSGVLDTKEQRQYNDNLEFLISVSYLNSDGDVSNTHNTYSVLTDNEELSLFFNEKTKSYNIVSFGSGILMEPDNNNVFRMLSDKVLETNERLTVTVQLNLDGKYESNAVVLNELVNEVNIDYTVDNSSGINYNTEEQSIFLSTSQNTPSNIPGYSNGVRFMAEIITEEEFDERIEAIFFTNAAFLTNNDFTSQETRFMVSLVKRRYRLNRPLTDNETKADFEASGLEDVRNLTNLVHQVERVVKTINNINPISNYENDTILLNQNDSVSTGNLSIKTPSNTLTNGEKVYSLFKELATIKKRVSTKITALNVVNTTAAIIKDNTTGLSSVITIYNNEDKISNAVELLDEILSTHDMNSLKEKIYDYAHTLVNEGVNSVDIDPNEQDADELKSLYRQALGALDVVEQTVVAAARGVTKSSLVVEEMFQLHDTTSTVDMDNPGTYKQILDDLTKNNTLINELNNISESNVKPTALTDSQYDKTYKTYKLADDVYNKLKVYENVVLDPTLMVSAITARLYKEYEPHTLSLPFKNYFNVITQFTTVEQNITDAINDITIITSDDKLVASVLHAVSREYLNAINNHFKLIDYNNDNISNIIDDFLANPVGTLNSLIKLLDATGTKTTAELYLIEFNKLQSNALSGLRNTRNTNLTDLANNIIIDLRNNSIPVTLVYTKIVCAYYKNIAALITFLNEDDTPLNLVELIDDEYNTLNKSKTKTKMSYHVYKTFLDNYSKNPTAEVQDDETIKNVALTKANIVFTNDPYIILLHTALFISNDTTDNRVFIENKIQTYDYIDSTPNGLINTTQIVASYPIIKDDVLEFYSLVFSNNAFSNRPLNIDLNYQGQKYDTTVLAQSKMLRDVYNGALTLKKQRENMISYLSGNTLVTTIDSWLSTLTVSENTKRRLKGYTYEKFIDFALASVHNIKEQSSLKGEFDDLNALKENLAFKSGSDFTSYINNLTDKELRYLVNLFVPSYIKADYDNINILFVKTDIPVDVLKTSTTENPNYISYTFNYNTTRSGDTIDKGLIVNIEPMQIVHNNHINPPDIGHLLNLNLYEIFNGVFSVLEEEALNPNYNNDQFINTFKDVINSLEILIFGDNAEQNFNKFKAAIETMENVHVNPNP